MKVSKIKIKTTYYDSNLFDKEFVAIESELYFYIVYMNLCYTIEKIYCDLISSHDISEGKKSEQKQIVSFADFFGQQIQRIEFK